MRYAHVPVKQAGHFAFSAESHVSGGGDFQLFA